MIPDPIFQELYPFAVSYSRIMGRGLRGNDGINSDDLLQEVLLVFLRVLRVYRLPAPELVKVAKEAARNRVRELLNRITLQKSLIIPLEGLLGVQSVPFLAGSGLSPARMAYTRLILGFLTRRLTERDQIVLRQMAAGYKVSEIAAYNGIPRRSVTRTVAMIRELGIEMAF